MTMYADNASARAASSREFEAGPDQVIVVYMPADLGIELEPLTIFGEIAADARKRADDGQRIVSMTSLPLRHAAAWAGREGSGYETKVAVAVTYERRPGLKA